MIYLDHAATTAVRPEAAQAALSVMLEGYGNPSSSYPAGRQAAKRLAQDRALLAGALGCRAEELYFTSCGTESDNWAILGTIERNRRRGNHILTTAIEHSAVLEPLKLLERRGFSVTRLMPDAQGNISLEQVRAALRPDTILVSMMLVNNELGNILPVSGLRALVQEVGAPALIHCDAVQGFLKLPFTPGDLNVDLLSISGHKLGAPKGIGALYVRRGLQNWQPLLRGGGQESALRPGTEATAQIAAFACAAALGATEREAHSRRLTRLREHLLHALQTRLPQALPLGGGAPHILCLSLPGCKSEVLVRILGDMGFCVSAGSACHRGKPSHVFAALPIEKAKKEGALRVSLGAENTEEELDAFVTALCAAAERLCPVSQGYPGRSGQSQARPAGHRPGSASSPRESR